MAKKAIRGKGEGGLYQQADGLWAASFELPPDLEGKRRRKVIRRKSKRAAVDAMKAEQKKLAEHGDIPTDNLTVEKWFTYWMDHYVYPNSRPKTAAGYKSVVDNHIVPAIGKVRLGKITPAHVRKVQDRILETPKKASTRALPQKDWPADTVMLSSTYALNAHNIMSASFKIARREGRIGTNPCELTSAPRKRRTLQQALEVDQAIELLRFLTARDDGVQWATYLLTGARRGEILGLETDRVTDVLDLSWQLQRFKSVDNVPADFEYRDMGGGLYLTRPKSSAGWRIVPLVDPLKTILTNYIAATGREGLIFTRQTTEKLPGGGVQKRDTGMPQDPDTVSKAWPKMLTAAGLPSNVVLHGSRHTTVDLLYEAGVPETVIMEIVGHTNRTVTRGYKSKGNRKQLEDAMTKMSALLTAPDTQETL